MLLIYMVLKDDDDISDFEVLYISVEIAPMLAL